MEARSLRPTGQQGVWLAKASKHRRLTAIRAPLKQAKVTDEASYVKGGVDAATAAVELSLTWAPKFGVAASDGSQTEAVIELVKATQISQVALQEAQVIHRAVHR